MGAGIRILDIFRNEILAACQPVSLPKYVNVDVILISDFVISEIRIDSTFRPFRQAGRIFFRKTSIIKSIYFIFKVTYVNYNELRI